MTLRNLIILIGVLVAVIVVVTALLVFGSLDGSTTPPGVTPVPNVTSN